MLPLLRLGELTRVAALRLFAPDAEVEEGCAEALHLLLHDRPDVEARHNGAEPPRRRDRLEAGDARSQHEYLRRRNRARRRHQHREETRQPLRGEQDRLVPGYRALR